MLPERKRKEFSDSWFSTAWPSDVTASFSKKYPEFPKCRNTNLSKNSPAFYFQRTSPESPCHSNPIDLWHHLELLSGHKDTGSPVLALCMQVGRKQINHICKRGTVPARTYLASSALHNQKQKQIIKAVSLKLIWFLKLSIATSISPVLPF